MKSSTHRSRHRPAVVDKSIDSSLFDEWTQGRTLTTLGTNAGALPLPFQTWHHFKEAFSPELVRDALAGAGARPLTCLDPFGGSGTTALTAQLLGASATTIEVNPFLVDVIRAKTTLYDGETLRGDLSVIRRSRVKNFDCSALDLLPRTFVEPGRDGKWLFDAEVAIRVARLLYLIERVEDSSARRFFRVVLGGLLVDLSNVVVSGKGRRYRRNWSQRRRLPGSVDSLFAARALAAIGDVVRFTQRPGVRIDVLHGDARLISPRRMHDVAVFSPPYPNSFDYTDVYNIELWMLGYLRDAAANRALRLATLRSHVQVHAPPSSPPKGSQRLLATLDELDGLRTRLWDPNIPEMIAAYFSDLVTVIERTFKRLRPGATCWLVVGSSRYGGVCVPTAEILAELAPSQGWHVQQSIPFRAMRSSPQNGGRPELAETLLVLRAA